MGWQLVAGRRYTENDEDLKKFIRDQIELSTIAQGPMMIYNYFPWVEKLMPVSYFRKIFGFDQALTYIKDFRIMAEGIIEEHNQKLDPENPMDLIDQYLLNGIQKDDPMYYDLISMLWDMFVAGNDTTTNTLRWIILYMALHPEIQTRLQNELDEVIPDRRLPSIDDRDSMPYAEACYMEALRLSSFANIGLPHTASSTVKLDKYVIPKDTMLFACLESCHKDPKYWERPHEYYPEHFMDSKGNLVTNNPAFMPFGLGKRQCLGKSLARTEIFLFSSAILQRFRIECPSDQPKPSMEPTTEQFLLKTPRNYEVVLKRRGSTRNPTRLRKPSQSG